MSDVDGTLDQENLNPYEAPKAAELVEEAKGDSYLETLEFKKLEKLYYRSHNVSSLAGLMIIGTSLIVILMFTMDSPILPMGILVALIAYNGITIFGIIQRSSWGRIMGIINCILMLINLNIISILIGVMGLFAFFGAPELFGPDRITHAELKEVYKRRKKERKLKR